MFYNRILLAAKTTGISGLPVHPAPRSALIGLFNDTLKALDKIPQDAVYRQSVTALTNHRLKIVESTENVKEIEEKLAAGRIEQVIIQAQDELKLVHKMAEWKPWEKLEVKPEPGQWEYFQQKSESK
ncbi:hypothetical protein MP638_003814 [Amoeboaphelidium occidentale]|nr:hypothetical protein MP638_003814 [Amoeboaphelidium occidentale]